MDEQTERAGRQAVDAALKVHRALGLGLLESAYEHCLARELFLRKVPFQRQLQLPITYEGVTLDAAYRLDFVVDERVVVDFKALDGLLPIDEAQLLTYLRLSGLRLGLLMNFNAVLLKHGLRRLVL